MEYNGVIGCRNGHIHVAVPLTVAKFTVTLRFKIPCVMLTHTTSSSPPSIVEYAVISRLKVTTEEN